MHCLWLFFVCISTDSCVDLMDQVKLYKINFLFLLKSKYWCFLESQLNFNWIFMTYAVLSCVLLCSSCVQWNLEMTPAIFVLLPAVTVVNTAALLAKVLPQMAQWSTLPCCSCLFSTVHPHNEIASLQQFALIQHSGRACRCSSCTGKRWENEQISRLQKQHWFRWLWKLYIMSQITYLG